MTALAAFVLVVLIEQPNAKTCGDAILEFVGRGDAFCFEEERTLAPATTIRPKPRPAP